MSREFIEEIASYVRASLLAFIAEGEGTTSEYDFRAGMILTPKAEAERDAFKKRHYWGGCRCCVSPPCGYCTDPGNPLNQEEDDSAWMPSLTNVANAKGGA